MKTEIEGGEGSSSKALLATALLAHDRNLQFKFIRSRTVNTQSFMYSDS